ASRWPPSVASTKGGPQPRVSSPLPLRSTLMTSAPRSARICPAQGPARIRASSSTRSPAKGPAITPPWGEQRPRWRKTAVSVARRTRLVHTLRTSDLARFVNLSGQPYLSSDRLRDGPVSTSSFSDMLQSIAERGRALIDRTRDRRGVAEPRRLELFRRLNLAPGGTAALVRMREQLMDAMDHRDDLAVIDDDFLHLFSSWFNRGFLVLRSIDWSTPANLLEKIIRYEAV